MRELDTDKQRWFAIEVVRQLRAAGHESYWAGGCVRDQLLGRPPKDYDVATSARPEQIREVFGQRRTLAVGAAFGVITVLGPKGAGQIEVATFRQDLGYSDGRRPDEVRYSSPREDALRRDFTINGMFYDPLAEKVIDFVGGQDDLQHRAVRAIGEPRERLAEDKLRMLRAVRFAAALDFSIETETMAAIREMAAQIAVVSAERIAAEMRAMLQGPGRGRAMELLRETGLLEQVLPEITGAATLHHDAQAHPSEDEVWRRTLQFLDALDRPSFPQALAVLLGWPEGERLVSQVGARWRLSNSEIDRTAWLLRHSQSLIDAAQKPWSDVQPILVHNGAGDLLALYETAVRLGRGQEAELRFCRQKRALPDNELNPPPLVTGEDLIALGVPKGKLYATLLKAAREAQLDGVVHSAEEAKDFVARRWRESTG